MKSHALLGQKFGQLLVVGQEPSSRNRSMWRCICECGQTTIVPANPLVTGRTKSCGCLRHKILKSANFKHGHSGTRTHNIWRGILKRCQTKTCKAYKHYGGRGITICDRWKDFGNFYADMGEAPDGYSIERIDVDGNYEPSNCEWIHKDLQPMNRRLTLRITINEETKPLSSWCEEKGLRYGLVYDRIARLGWPPERALGEAAHV